MEVSKVKSVLSACAVTNECALLVGHAGIGKTQVIRQWAEEQGYHCDVVIASLLEPSDIQGMPYIENNITHFAEPVFFSRLHRAVNEKKRPVLVFDELNRAPKDVLGAMLTLILEREVNGHKLPKDTLIVAAINPDSDGDYQVDTLDAAMRNRFLILNVESDAQSWLKYARDTGVNQVVRDFIAENPTKLYFQSKDQDELAIATPRSWEMLGKFVDTFKTVDPELHFEIIKGKIGLALGSQFYNFFLNYVNVIKVEDIEKFVKKYKDINATTIEGIGQELYKDKLQNIETVTQMELVHQMADKYFKKAKDQKGILPLLVTLYALNIETLASILKEHKASRITEYKQLAEWDFDKNLFRRITNKIEA